MAQSPLRLEVRGGQSRESVSFDFSAFEELPDDKRKNTVVWTPDMDEALRRYWIVKKQKDVARLLGVCVNTARDRYAYLTKV